MHNWMATEKELIKREEGMSLTPYKDDLGNWSIGYGHHDKYVGKHTQEMSREHVEQMFNDDFNRALGIAIELYPEFFNLTDARKGALVHMAFQLGEGGMASFKSTLRLMATDNWIAAAYHIRHSKWAKQAPFRANRIAERIESGNYRQ